jgi:[ribosomal protein S5]-alanine N-acetyltransferase
LGKAKQSQSLPLSQKRGKSAAASLRFEILAELSFWLAVTAWGKGYMSEALRTGLKVSFGQLNLNRLCAYHMLRNPGSGRVLQKNGFMQAGLLRQRVRK